MPQFGQAHKLLSTRHRDTIPPAGGIDPSDGQIPTWSTALKAWIAADPAPGGVTVHGLLDGLDVDDHAQYALADKSRPDPWVSAADLYWRDIEDIGARQHNKLQFLHTDDHPIYISINGRVGGQTILGSPNPGEYLTLQGTSHATPTRVKVQDDLQLLSDIIRDSGDNIRITVDTSSPEVALTGDLDVSKHIGVGSGGYCHTGKIVNVVGTLDIHPANGIYCLVTGNRAVGPQLTYGVFGGAEAQGTPTYAVAMGLNFYAKHSTASPCFYLTGIYVQLQSGAAGSGAINTGRGLHLPAAYYANAKPATVRGIDIEQQGAATVGVAEGLKIADQTATTVRLLELGPAVPYLRLLGGANPAANQSHLYLKLGATLKQLTEYDADSAGVGYRALRVPN